MGEPAPKRLEPQLLWYYGGRDVRTLKRQQLLKIIAELGTEVKDLREKNLALERRRFYPR